MLDLKNVSKLYANQRGVDNVDFSMSRGEIVGFLGPNGAGKTTTMRMITGYLNPNKGQITIDGMTMAEHPRKVRRKIGYLPETPPLYPEMSVKAYLSFVADLRDVSARDKKKRIEEVISKLGLHGRERQIIRSLSKGYRQRVGLAQAIIHKPDLLVMDEPTSGLDPNQIIEIRQLIKELGENHTVLLSTHILPEVNAICNRVLIIHQGKIVLDGKPNQLSNDMNDQFTVNLEVKGPKQDIIKQLSAIEQVKTVNEVNIDIPVSEHTSQLQVISRDRTDIREAIFHRMSEFKYPILEMKKESMSLEDIFIKLTATEPAVIKTQEQQIKPETQENQETVEKQEKGGADSDA